MMEKDLQWTVFAWENMMAGWKSYLFTVAYSKGE